jgi:predicted TIM-barrel fold metal-dependent hydrolase
MIIDGDTHITFTGEGIKVEELLEMMDIAGVEKAIVWLQPPYFKELTEELNKYVYESAKRYPDKILGFGWLDPHLGIKRCKDLIKKFVYEYNFYGIKLNGAQNDFYIDDPNLSLPLIEEIAKTDKIIAFHIGADAYERTHPFRLRNVAKMFPELKILAVHMGGAGIPDLSNAMIEFSQECSNITLIGSAISSKSILKAISVLGANRVCFGSDTPFELMYVEVAKYKALLSNVLSEEERSNIMGRNIAKLLNIS